LHEFGNQLNYSSEEAEKKEKHALSTSYYAGYLFNTLVKHRAFQSAPVFYYNQEWKALLFGGPFKHFMFAGDQRYGIFVQKAREAIDRKEYVNCEKAIRTAGSQESNVLSNVIIAGTCDEGICQKFKEYFLRDVAKAYAMRMDTEKLRNNPYSVTPVASFKNGKLIEIGELQDIKKNEEARKNVISGNFVHCDNFPSIKTL